MIRINLQPRVQRNMLIQLAGLHYRDYLSPLIVGLNKVGASALIGIEREDGVYTVIGKCGLYYRTSLGQTGEIPFPELLEALTSITLSVGKAADYEYVKLRQDTAVWFMNANVMSALWNTALLLYQAGRESDFVVLWGEVQLGR